MMIEREEECVMQMMMMMKVEGEGLLMEMISGENKKERFRE